MGFSPQPLVTRATEFVSNRRQAYAPRIVPITVFRCIQRQSVTSDICAAAAAHGRSLQVSATEVDIREQHEIRTSPIEVTLAIVQYQPTGYSGFGWIGFPQPKLEFTLTLAELIF